MTGKPVSTMMKQLMQSDKDLRVWKTGPFAEAKVRELALRIPA